MPPLTRPYPLLELQYLLVEHTNGEVLESLVKAVFVHTNVFDIMSVMNTLSLVEAWMGILWQQKGALSPSFDVDFFCKGLDILFSTEHHQVILRVLQVIYTYAELFTGNSRQVLFGDFILDKHFFKLFLHWDPGVRNAFQQTLIFKMVRIKRSVLSKDGFVVRELVKLNFKALSSTTSPSSSEPASPSTTTDSSTSSTHEIQPSQNGTDTPLNSAQAQAQASASAPPNAQAQAPTTPTHTLLEDGATSMDATFYVKLDCLLKQIEHQICCKDSRSDQLPVQYFPESYEVYAPIALTEYKNHLSKYHQWEQRDADPPKLLPLALVSCMQE